MKINRQMQDDYMYLLPFHIIVEIFLKLPLSTIFQCMRVCKTWRNILLSDSYFAQLHLAKSTADLLIFSDSCGKLGLVELDEGRKYSRTKKQFLDFSTQDCYPTDISCVWNSCNGLLLLSDASQVRYYVCNPIRRECVRLPEVQEAPIANELVSAGIGFFQQTNQYKVIRIVGGSSKYSAKCAIHTLGTHLWRNIGNVPYPKSPIVFFKGVFHWLDFSFQMIWSIKIHEEKLESIPIPPPNYPCTIAKLGVLNDHLIMWEGVAFYIQIWVMKTYGVIESWTKDWKIVFPNDWIGKNISSRFLQPLKVTKDGELLVSYGKSNGIASYDPKKRTLKKQKIYRMSKCFQQMGFIASFISPNDAMRGANLN